MPDGFCTFKIPLTGKAKDKIIQREEEIMKKFACFALTAALLLAGCGGTDGDNAAQSQTETGSAAQESTAQESTGQTEQEGTQTEGTQTESTEAASANGASIKAGDYSYHVESLEKEWTTDNGTLACTVKLAYPVFEGDTEGEKNINAFFKEWADDKLDYYENDKDSIVNIALQYQTELETEQNSTQEDSTLPPVPPSEEDFSVGGVTVRGSVISVFMEFYSYEGGAHGMPGRANYLFDKTTGKETTLASLISISEEELNQKVRGLFQEQVKGNTEGFFEDAEETLNNKTDFIDNYYFSEDGVGFYATPYEIAPYAAGYTEVTVPFEELGL